MIARHCCYCFIYYITTESHPIWKTNIASPVHGIIFLRVAFTHMLHINVPSEKISSLGACCDILHVWLFIYLLLLNVFIDFREGRRGRERET